jgi:thymidylate kinase
MDNFVFGAVQGLSYSQTDALLRTSDLERPSCIIYLVADPAVAYERIRADPGADKFETPDFIRTQYRETLAFYRAAADQRRGLEAFHGIPATLIDTTQRTRSGAFRAAERFLAGLGVATS